MFLLLVCKMSLIDDDDRWDVHSHIRATRCDALPPHCLASCFFAPAALVRTMRHDIAACLQMSMMVMGRPFRASPFLVMPLRAAGGPRTARTYIYLQSSMELGA